MAGEIKKLYFSDGAAVTAPSDLAVAGISLKAYADDAAYVAANGAAVDGSAYVNTTSTIRTIRMYVNSAWRNVSIAADPADATKLLVKDLSGQTTGTTLTIASVITANRTWTHPDFDSTYVGTTGTQTISGTKTHTAAKLEGAVISGGSKTLDVDSAANLTIGASVGANNVTIGGASSTVVIPGNLTVSGTTTQIDTTNLNVEDTNILVNDGGNDASAEGAGITVERTSTNGSIKYEDALTSKWKIGALGSESEVITAGGAQAITGTKTIASPTVTGTLLLQNPSGAQPKIALTEDPDNGTSVVNLMAPDALAGDLTIKLPTTAGASGFFLQTDGSGNTTWASAASGAGSDSPMDATNYSIQCSVAANALTIALKTKGGADPSGGDPVMFAFRNATNATGDYTVVSATAATSLVISSGSTLGQNSGQTCTIYVYALNNAGTIELVASGLAYNDTVIQSTTAEGGAGAADSKTTLYSTTARANKAIRLIATLVNSQATAGTWVSVPSIISLMSDKLLTNSEYKLYGFLANGSTDTAIARFNSLAEAHGSGITRATSAANGDTFTINERGIYAVTQSNASAAGGFNIGISVNSNQLTTNINSITAAHRMASQTTGTDNIGSVSWTGLLEVGDVVRAHNNTSPTSPTLSDAVNFTIVQVSKL